MLEVFKVFEVPFSLAENATLCEHLNGSITDKLDPFPVSAGGIVLLEAAFAHVLGKAFM